MCVGTAFLHWVHVTVMVVNSLGFFKDATEASKVAGVALTVELDSLSIRDVAKRGCCDMGTECERGTTGENSVLRRARAHA